MKSYLIIAASLLLSSCLTGPEPDTVAPQTPSSSSQQQAVYPVSSQSVPEQPVATYPSSQYLPSSATSVPIAQPEITFIAEMGMVCVGFNTQAVTLGKATEGYLAMYSICGDMSQMTTGTQPRTAEVIANWLVYDLNLNSSDVDILISDMTNYGSSFRFYNAVDGYLRYVYIEPVGDGKGLMRTRATD